VTKGQFATADHTSGLSALGRQEASLLLLHAERQMRWVAFRACTPLLKAIKAWRTAATVSA